MLWVSTTGKFSQSWIFVWIYELRLTPDDPQSCSGAASWKDYVLYLSLCSRKRASKTWSDSVRQLSDRKLHLVEKSRQLWLVHTRQEEINHQQRWCHMFYCTYATFQMLHHNLNSTPLPNREIPILRPKEMPVPRTLASTCVGLISTPVSADRPTVALTGPAEAEALASSALA